MTAPIRAASVGFTGTSRALTVEECAYVRAVVAGIDADRYVTGGALGVDTVVHLVAAGLRPSAEHLVLVPDAPWSEDTAERATVERVPGGKTAGESYMLRNDAIVAAADLLVAFPETAAGSLRSGTWATVRRARRAGVPVLIFPLSEAGA